MLTTLDLHKDFKKTFKKTLNPLESCACLVLRVIIFAHLVDPRKT